MKHNRTGRSVTVRPKNVGKLTCFYAGILAGNLTLLASLAQAQSTIAANSDALQEIVVTAERREVDIQKTPISITALSGADLQEQGKNTVEDILRSVPGVNVQDGLGNSAIFIRGVGPTLSTDPAVSTSVDGIYQTDTFEGTQFDVSRVEVLRGPQGTLYGRNATAGSVNIITNDPIHENTGSGSIEFGNYSAVRTEGMFNADVSSELAFRGAFLTSNHTGYLSNGADDEDTDAFRLKGLFTPINNLRILAAIQDIHFGGHGDESVPAPLGARSDPWSTTLANGTQSNLVGAQDNRKTDFYGRVDYDFNWGVLTYQPSYYNYRIHQDEDLLGSGLSVSEQELYQRTQELRIASPSSSTVRWLAGIYYLEHDNTPDRNASTLTGGGELAPGLHPPVALPTVVTSNRDTAKAAFGQVTVPVATRLRLTGGVRYTQDDKTATGTELIVSTTPQLSVSQKDSAVTWKGGVEYDLSDQSLLYVRLPKVTNLVGSMHFPAA